MFVALLTLPLIAYLGVYLRRPELFARNWVAPAAAAAAVGVAVLGVIFLISTLPQWENGTEIAWTGVGTRSDRLAIGGHPEEAIIGWPNESFAPALEIEVKEEGRAGLSLRRGGAFVRDETRQVYLNGELLRDGETHQMDGYSFHLKRGWWFSRRWLEVSDATGTLLVRCGLPNSVSRDRVVSLEALSDANDLDIEAGSPTARLIHVFKEWARDVRVLLTTGGETGLLAPEKEYRAECQLPCRLQAIWVGTRQGVTIARQDGVLRASFPPPWRVSTPLPRSEGGDEQKMVLTAQPRIDDLAIVLPFGRGAADVRRDLILDRLPSAPVRLRQAGEKRLEPQSPPPLPPDVLIVKREMDVARVTSSTAVVIGPIEINLAAIDDLPRLGWLIALLLTAWMVFAAGLFLCARALADATSRWLICGMTGAIWNLLLFRALLSLRYAQEPSYLDSLSVSGVIESLTALTIVPGILLSGAALTSVTLRGARGKDVRRVLGAHLALLLAGGAFVFLRAPGLWANLPPGYVPFLRGKVLGLMLIVGSVGLLVLILLAVTMRRESRAGRAIKALTISAPKEWIITYGRRFWGRAANNAGWKNLISFILMAQIVIVVGLLVSLYILSLFSLDAVMQFIIPLFFVWPIAGIWLAIRLTPAAGGIHRLSLGKLLILVAATIVPTVFLLPLVISDVGRIMAMLAVFLPLSVLLVLAPPRRAGAVILTVIFSILLLGIKIGTSQAVRLPGAIGVRLLTHQEGKDVQHRILFANAMRGSRNGGVPLRSLQNAYQHAWENKAIAHEGKYSGTGYGQALTRRSQVRQDTIQFDSTFSFFILGEFGLIGGLLLLLLYALPIGLLVVGGRGRFDAGHGLAVLIFSSLFIEAATQALMNLGEIWFTGRSLPLLAVNSLCADLFRWTPLLYIALQAILWREGKDPAAAIQLFDPKLTQAKAGSTTGKWSGSKFGFHILPELRMALLPGLFIIWVACAGWRVVSDSGLDKPFGWDGVLETARYLIRERIITLNQETLELAIDQNRIQILPDSLAWQEIDRFNALPREARVEGLGYDDLTARMRKVRSLTDYDRFMEEWRASAPRRVRRPNLFRVVPATRWVDEGYEQAGDRYRVLPNPEFNTRLTFSAGVDPKSLPSTAYLGGNRKLIGSAWVNGKWIAVNQPDSAISWTRYLAGALARIWPRLDPQIAAAHYGELTLDEALQNAVHRFATEKGRELHGRLLAQADRARAPRPDESRIQAWLPPRVAITILSLPNGEVRALGGWPRLSSTRQWRKGEDNREWLPPLMWEAGAMLPELRKRYEGDRNFDLMLVGSATKPIWAAAVLARHPDLHRKLQVRGAGGIETSVFGIPIAAAENGWKVSTTEWLNFSRYLADSDNRYQIRLGFLGLAEKAGDEIAVEPEASRSENESYRQGRPSPWRKYPKFDPAIGFSAVTAGQMRNLGSTELASRLRMMFSVGVSREQEFSSRLSFWTLHERDDLGGETDRLPEEREDGKTSMTLFADLAPVPVNLDLDRAVGRPRDYVSLLLGGGTNRWSNVDLAAAFGASVTGQPVLAHMVRNGERPELLEGREPFVEIAGKLRPGLGAVISNGTATSRLQRTGGMRVLEGLKARGLDVYAKTGTLKTDPTAERYTSRILCAVVRWANRDRKEAATGLVISIVGEEAEVGEATTWLGELLARHEKEISRLLGI